MWQVEELPGARARKGEELRRKCQWPSTRDFEIEGRRYSLRSCSKGGRNKAAKVVGNGTLPR
jgi:hypothetical protein